MNFKIGSYFSNISNINFGSNKYMSRNKNKNSQTLSFNAKNNKLTENEIAFRTFKTGLSRKIHKLATKLGIAEWNYYINSNKENLKKYNEFFDENLKLWSNKKTYTKILGFEEKGVNDKTLKRTIKKLIHDFKDNVSDVGLHKKLKSMENNIAKTVNSYKGVIDGKEYSNADLVTILDTEKNPEIRQKAYNARFVDISNKVEKDLINLVKERNLYAQKKGYNNFYSYMLKEEYKVDEKQLFNVVDKIVDTTRPIYKLLRAKENAETAKTFGIPEEKLQPWHYGLLSKDNPENEVNKYIKDNTQMENLVYDMYDKMGWKVKEMPITLDLYPKANKNQHGFCFDLNPNKDARILANLKNDVQSTQTLLHEMGHSVYALKYSPKLQYLDQTTHHATTEAVAMMMETVPDREAFYTKALNLPKSISEKLEINRLKNSLKFVNRYATLINFEKSMYENPDQDLSKLWFEMRNKYEMRNMPDKIVNEWANIPHLLSCPAYLQNYFRAEIMQNQMYDTAHKALGNLTENTDTAKFFEKKLFKYGTSLEENELLKKFTGSELNPEALCRTYEKLLKVLK